MIGAMMSWKCRNSAMLADFLTPSLTAFSLSLSLSFLSLSLSFSLFSLLPHRRCFGRVEEAPWNEEAGDEYWEEAKSS